MSTSAFAASKQQKGRERVTSTHGLSTCVYFWAMAELLSSEAAQVPPKKGRIRPWANKLKPTMLTA